jgi:hypothetical protein
MPLFFNKVVAFPVGKGRTMIIYMRVDFLQTGIATYAL